MGCKAMVEDGFDAARRAAAGGVRAEVSTKVLAEMALPAAAAGALALFVAPTLHGAPLGVTVTAITTILGGAAINAGRLISATGRIQRAEASLAQATAAIDQATSATQAVLGLVRQAIAPSLDEIAAVSGGMADDRRVSATTRSRFAGIRDVASRALAMLGDTAAPVAAPQPQAQSEVAATPQAAAAPFDPAVADFEGLRMLVAEANGAHQLGLRAHLAHVGADAQFVTSRAELLEAWQGENWDLILLDVDSEALGGPATARTIREFEVNYGWLLTPIVALGAATAGADGWISKPIGPQALYAAMGQALTAPRAKAQEPLAAVA